MQKMIYVCENNTKEINSYLSTGWRVVNMKATGSGQDSLTVCYVVIEKDEKTAVNPS